MATRRLSANRTSDGATPKPVGRFLEVFQPEEARDGPVRIWTDARNDTDYVYWHLDGATIAQRADLAAVMDPETGEEYRMNRDLNLEAYAYKLMERDALAGRSFEDIVVEFDESYKQTKPLKVFGGQHRVNAITQAWKAGISNLHGVRVFFDLTDEQKVDIATVNNTSILVSNDLLDRMQEDLLGNELRDWSQKCGMLQLGQNFADRRNAEGVITVRHARTFVVNFIKGRQTKQGEPFTPYVCSSGPKGDAEYEKLRASVQWEDPSLLEAGQHFSSLHQAQRQALSGKKAPNEFLNKSIHPSVLAAWAYVSGMFQADASALKKHYALPDAKATDPLNAKALLNARFKGKDPDTYRGLGARISSVELGRMVEVFFVHAKDAKDVGITLKLANAAIQSYEAKRATYQAALLKRGL